MPDSPQSLMKELKAIESATLNLVDALNDLAAALEIAAAAPHETHVFKEIKKQFGEIPGLLEKPLLQPLLKILERQMDCCREWAPQFPDEID